MKKNKYKTIVVFCILALVLSGRLVYAQDVTQQAITPMPENDGVTNNVLPNPSVIDGDASVNVEPIAANPDNLFAPSTDVEKGISEQLKFLNPSVNVNLMPSLLFSVWEHDLIIDARRGLKSGLSSTAIGSGGEVISEISLGGIVYKSSTDWTIWLNNTRVLPNAIPSQILDLKVFKDYIQIEWFDSSRNLIFPIKLRPHQRFNLDTRLFLSGQ